MHLGYMCVLPYTNYILNQISTLVYSRAVSKKKKFSLWNSVFKYSKLLQNHEVPHI